MLDALAFRGEPAAAIEPVHGAVDGLVRPAKVGAASDQDHRCRPASRLDGRNGASSTACTSGSSFDWSNFRGGVGKVL